MFCLQDVFKVPHKLLINIQARAVVFYGEINFTVTKMTDSFQGFQNEKKYQEEILK